MQNVVRSIRWQCALTLLAVLVLFSLPMAAQEASGRVIGVVTDPTGSVIPKAKVTVTNVDTGSSTDAITGPDGSYQVPLLQVGSYRVTAEAQGFRKTVTAPQRLEINQSLKVDVKLEVGSTTETVQVEANASGVETVVATLGGVVAGTQIAEAPLNGRNVLDLATLLPGVVPVPAGGGNGTFNIAGARGDSVTFLLDGGMNNDLLSNGVVYNPNPDSIEEFRVLTSNYSPEYGRNAGGIVSMVTKSGTNEYHGVLFDYIRNNDFNANKFFNNQQGLPVDILKRNQFGAEVGGPLSIPKLFNAKNRLFFMVSWQSQRQVSATTASSQTVFTPTELTGDFSHSGPNGGPDPKVVSWLQQFPYFQPNPGLAAQGVIDPTRIDPVSQNYIKAGLIPSTASGLLFLQASVPNNNDELTSKVDFVITDRDRLAVTIGAYRTTNLSIGNPAASGSYPSSNGGNRYLGSASYTKTLSANMVNEFRFTAQRNNIKQAFPARNFPTPAQLGVGITPDQATGPTRLYFYDSGLTNGFSPQGPTQLINNTYIWNDTFSFIKGDHAFKTGFNYTPFQNNTVYDFYVNGEFDFYGVSGAGIGSQNEFADFLMGIPDEYFQFGAAPSNIRSHNIGWYFQDEWKVRKNLTLTLGIRYEYSSPKLDLQGRSFNLAFGQQSQRFPNAPLGVLFPGDPGAPRGSNFPDRNDWAPRFGFAWDPKGDGKMSIRGGVGVFYDILKGEDNLQFNGQAPFFGFVDMFFSPPSSNPTGPLNNFSQPFVATGQPNPFPSKTPPKNIDFAASGFLPIGGGGVYYVNPHLRTPYVYQYNFSVQREIWHDTTLEVSYLGSDSHKLTTLKDGNPFILGTNTRLFNTQPGVPSNGFSYLPEFNNAVQGYYDGLAVGLHKRYSDTKFGSFLYQFSYTYGHSIDNSSGFRATNSQVPAYDWNRFRADSDFDVRHNIVFSGSWELPFNKMWGSGPSRLTRGWTLYPIVSYRTGTPMTIIGNQPTTRRRPGPSGAGDGGLVLANQVNVFTTFDAHNTQSLAGNAGNFYFDPSAFSIAEYEDPNFDPVNNPSQRTYGSSGRNAYRGPSRTNFNLTIAKTTALFNERVRLEIRADFFNVLNHTQFTNPNSNIGSSQFGQISSTFDPRIIQLAGRFTF